MTKIYRTENLPQKINVVSNRKIIAEAVFIDDVYETDNEQVVKELKDYGYKIEADDSEKVIETAENAEEEIDEETSEPENAEDEIEKPKNKNKSKNKNKNEDE